MGIFFYRTVEIFDRKVYCREWGAGSAQDLESGFNLRSPEAQLHHMSSTAQGLSVLYWAVLTWSINNSKRCIYDLNLVVVFSLRVYTESVAPNLGYLSYVRPLRSRKTKLTLVTSYHMTSPLFSSIFSKR